jgi:dihydroorotate dehydrogenase
VLPDRIDLLDNLYGLSRRALFKADPERVHDLTLKTMARISASPKLLSRLERASAEPDERLSVELFGSTVPSPLGIAAGLDKNAVAFPALLALGFSSVEIGTVTPTPQLGNERPRIFRLADDEALINRMGFPSAGLDAVETSLAHLHRRGHHLGCNIGPNKSSVEAGTSAVDCIAALRRLSGFAAYSVINVSSPNTARLRDLQGKEALRALLRDITSAVPRQRSGPLLVKIAPDLTPSELHDLLDVIHEFALDGVVATNTTITRPASLQSAAKREQGGLSGRPLAPLSSSIVRQIARATSGNLPIIAAGGIFTGEDVLNAIAQGASFVQTYTGFIFRGPAMPRLVLEEMIEALDREGVGSIRELRQSAT